MVRNGEKNENKRELGLETNNDRLESKRKGIRESRRGEVEYWTAIMGLRERGRGQKEWLYTVEPWMPQVSKRAAEVEWTGRR